VISFRSVSGRRINLEEPRPSDIRLDDIACGLSNVCRFSGQVREFYSVAQHSVLVSTLVPSWLGWAALHHDDTEAYLCDLSRHLKHHDLLAGYRLLEARLDAVIRGRFKIELTGGDRAMIKAADDLSAIWEHWILRLDQPWDAPKAVRWAKRVGFVGTDLSRLVGLASRLPKPHEFRPQAPRAAEAMFLLQGANLKGRSL
jgi:hypothetical protein